MKAKYLSIAIGASLFAITGLAQANTTYSSFVDIANSVSFDGWNQLTRNRVGGALTSAQLLAGSTANVNGSGDSILKLLSPEGSYAPAGAGLYGSGGSLSFTDNTVVSNITSIVFQSFVNTFDATPLSVSLNYNGAAQALAGSLTKVGSYYTYSWDLAAISAPITSYTINLTGGHAQSFAFQVDQVAAVPEADSYAMMLLGLGVMGAVVRRRNK